MTELQLTELIRITAKDFPGITIDIEIENGAITITCAENERVFEIVTIKDWLNAHR